MSVSSCCATSGRSEGTTGSPPASGGSGIVPVAWKLLRPAVSVWVGVVSRAVVVSSMGASDRKSTRLNSSHVAISYAVFCLKKKKEMGHDHIGQQQMITNQR